MWFVAVCYVDGVPADADDLVGFPSCPCRAKFTCVGSGMSEVPYGETGNYITTVRHYAVVRSAFLLYFFFFSREFC